MEDWNLTFPNSLFDDVPIAVFRPRSNAICKYKHRDLFQDKIEPTISWIYINRHLHIINIMKMSKWEKQAK